MLILEVQRDWRRVPVVCALIGLCLLGAAIVWLGQGGGFWPWLGFPVLPSGAVDYSRWWQLLTPALLHFSLMHLIFNCLALWILGGPLELFHGSRRLALVIIVSAVVSNWIQFLFSASIYFGGMSGAVYGLVGYLLCWNRLHPTRAVPVPENLLWMMVVFLLLGFTGLFELLLNIRVANPAHLAGLVCGVSLALGLGGLSVSGRGGR